MFVIMVILADYAFQNIASTTQEERGADSLAFPGQQELNRTCSRTSETFETRCTDFGHHIASLMRQNVFVLFKYSRCKPQALTPFLLKATNHEDRLD